MYGNFYDQLTLFYIHEIPSHPLNPQSSLILSFHYSSCETDKVVNSQPVVTENVGLMGIPPRARPPSGQWNDGLCDCCNNCWPSCCCSFCICNGVYILSQIIEKTRYNGGGNGWSVFNTAIGLFILGIVLIIITILAEVQGG